MIQERKGKRLVGRFESFDDFIDYVSNTRPVWEKSSLASEQDDFKFNQTDSFDHAVDLASNGWEAGRDLMSDVIDEFDSNLVHAIALETRELDVGGDFPDVGIAVTGDPVCMENVTMAETPSPVIRIGVSGTFNYKVKGKQVMYRGGAIASYVDALENQGWRVELVWNGQSVTSGTGKLDDLEFQIMLKEANQPVDIDRLSFALAHPAMLRRLEFRLDETIADAEENFCFGYGSARHKRPSDVDIWIPGFEPNSADEALARIASIVQKELHGNTSGE